MRPLTPRTVGRMPTGCYEILIDWTADPTGSEVPPDELPASALVVCQCVIAALRELAPLMRVYGEPLMKPLKCGLYWVVLRLVAESSSADFELDSPVEARVRIEELVAPLVRGLFPDIVMWNTRIAYRPEMPWI